jgi:hypothetical protein
LRITCVPACAGSAAFYLLGKIVRIPPYNPETLFGRAQAVLAAANSLAEAAHVNKELSGELSAVPQKLTQEAVGQLSKAATQGLAMSA